MDVTISAGFSGRPYDLRMRIYTIENNIGGNYSRYHGDRYAYSRSGYGSYMNSGVTVDSWIAGYYAGGSYSLPFAPGDFAGKTIGLGSYDTGGVGHDGAGNLSFTSRIRMLNASVFGSADTGDVWMSGDHIIRPPGAPSNLAVQPGSLTVNCFGVTYVGNGESITQYQAQWATDASFASVVWTDNGSSGLTKPCTATPAVLLTPGTTYYVRIRAYNAAGWGGWSSTLSQTTLPASAPSITVDSTPSGTGATVTNTPPAGGTPTKYTIERRVQGTTNPVISADSVSAVYNATNLTPGSINEWRSSVWYGTYQSPWTAWVAETQENPNTNPGDFFSGATPATADVTFTWGGPAQNSQSIATGKGVKGWEVSQWGLAGEGVLQRVTGGIYGAYGARVVVKGDCGFLGPVYSTGFEVNSTGWASGWSDSGSAPSAARANNRFHSGAWSFRLQDTYDSGGKSDAFYDFFNGPGPYYTDGYYRLSAWVYLAGGATKVTMRVDDIDFQTAETTTKNAWVQLSIEGYMDGSQSGLIFTTEGPDAATVDLSIDDMSWERIADPTGTSTGIRVGQKNAAGYRSAVIPGALYSASNAVSLPRPQRMMAEITYVDGAGALVARVYGNPVIVPANTNTTLVSSGVAPAGAAFALSRTVDVEGPGWSPWLAGEQFLIDGGMVTLAGPFPYFDGSSAPAGPYVYSWEGPAHNSISVRTTVDVPDTSLIDPDCVTVPPPPRPPAVPNTCIDETGLWRRKWYEVDAEDVREWFDTIPTVFITTGTQAVRQLRVRYYANPFDRPLASLDQDDFCGEIIVSYLPADSVLTLDGITQSAWASVSGGASMDANHLLYGSDGLPADWAVLECGIGYYITVDAPTESAEGNVSLDFELATRY